MYSTLVCLDVGYGITSINPLKTVTDLGSTEGCRFACSNNPDCLFWSWDSIGRNCYLFNDIQNKENRHLKTL